jgi:hypothetical protein
MLDIDVRSRYAPTARFKRQLSPSRSHEVMLSTETGLRNRLGASSKPISMQKHLTLIQAQPR